MMRAMQANQACKGKGVALGLCVGTNEVEFEDVDACVFCPLNAVVDSGTETCSLSDVASFCALVQSCGVAECHTHCLNELQAGADCIMREAGCDTCLPASSYPGVGTDASSGGVGFPGFFGFTFVSFIFVVYAVGIM